MELVLGIDLGTSYFKAGLFDRTGRLCGLGRAAVQHQSGEAGRCELPTELFWNLLRQALSSACRQAGCTCDDIAAISYSSQANSFILLDDDNRPLTNLILWPDMRAEALDQTVRGLWQTGDFLQTTGIGVDCGGQFCAAKLRWFQEQKPRLWRRVRRIMTISDYLTFELTAGAVGDAGTASLLGLLDVEKCRWWPRALDALGLTGSQLSGPLVPGTVAGRLTEKACELTGLKAGIILTAGNLDHCMAAVGAGVGKIAELSESTGTVLACLNFVNQYHPKNCCCVGVGGPAARYYQLAFSANGASALEWFKTAYAQNDSIADLVKLAEAVPIGSDGLVALPAPQLYEGLTGFRNIASHHRPAHYVRAIMESTAATLAQLVNLLSEGGHPNRIVATGGGAASERWLRIKADLLGTEFVTTACPEPACLGAAMFAAVAAGWFKTIAEAGSCWVKVSQTIKPDPSGATAYSAWLEKYNKQVKK